MKNLFRFRKHITAMAIILFLSFFAYVVNASIDGRTGRTLKTSTSGCSCHSSRDVATSVVITGPSSVNTGSTNTYTLTIHRATKTGAGCDIATRNGTLAPVSSTLHLSNSELTQNTNIPMVNNEVQFLFSYTAPASPVTDTIFATGLATNSDGNESGDVWNWASSFRVNVLPPPKILNLTVMIEGFYNTGTGNMINDTVRVYLRNTSAPYAAVDSATGFLNNAGSASFSFLNAVNGTPYYIRVKHRNSIETWSAGGNSFISNSMSYNFTTSGSQAFGSNQIQVGTKWTMFSGDVDQEGTVDLSDGSLIDNDAYNFETGYRATDVNGDEVTDLGDAVFADNNGFNFVGKITP
ncbi:MAG: hypothetical protein JSS91_07875 [Bacteroidetes bacterium]|nr:hypothetical protein [Bacteroidota bacterium]